ncbi:unnamed protein product [Candida verbasci]|uniref:Uncharacterized protein n=1 Tax=Candida verbasci TaxID=1227364 RepID=A0A9W4XEF8_9ASCO|nr:unnamed protein product [Candida verbasci]
MIADVDLLEQQKENINPLIGGRSASKLTKVFNDKSTTNYDQHKAKLTYERDQFEKLINESEESDDPLQSYINYLNWIHDNYSQGANTESGLINLLERCTSSFRDIYHYKNDPRYLKIWLEYTNYSDCPRDIFVYLARKEIGNQLALYYEEFANYLELNGKISDAEQIYELGIQSQAFPLNRLQRSYSNFKQRIQTLNFSPSKSIRNALSLKRGSNPNEEDQPMSKKSKLNIYKDEEPQDQSILYSIFGNDIDLQLGSTKSRVKENIMNAKKWAGEILKQKTDKASNEKIEIFRDQPETKRTVCFDENDKAYTLIESVGKRTEKVMINMDLIYHGEEENCPAELLAMSRRNQIPAISEPTLVEDEKTFTIPLNGDTTSKIKTQNEPTITMFSKLANHEVMNMFNGIAHDYNFEEEEQIKQDEPTNYDGFVTETVEVKQNQQQEERIPPTPPTEQEEEEEEDHEQQIHEPSSPFITQPDDQQIIDPFSESLKKDILNKLSVPLTAYPGYYDRSSIKVNRIAKFKEITRKNKSIMKGSQSAIIDYCGDDMYCLIHELGQGGYGYVYLIETGSNGILKALKIETPSARWEFYILHQIHRRLIDNFNDNNYFIQAESLYYFEDESFLILDYCSQSTLLDVVNHYKSRGSNVDEILIIYFTIELLKAVEILHNIGILHGDLKADNVMVRFDSIEDSKWSEQFDKSGGYGWDRKSIKLIDFGRAIDLTIFPKNSRFKSNLSKVDEQDCPQMNNGYSWSYEADYYGLASIIHTLLFGDYIKIINQGGVIKLKNSFKRYWQQDLWNELFKLLLNPYSLNEFFYEPKTIELRQIRFKFEDWLERHSKMRYLKKTIRELELELNLINKNRVQ